MDTYAVQSKLITNAHLQDFDLANVFLAYIKEKQVGHWSCHELCRAFSRLTVGLTWKVQDGYFGLFGYQHSWLWHRDPESNTVVILDVYPIAGAAPHMVVCSESPWTHLYIDRERAYSEDQLNQFELASAQIVDELNADYMWKKLVEKTKNMKFAP